MDPTTCPGCGCEPDIEAFAKRDGEIVGYRCSCHAVVVDGVLQGTSY